MAEKARNGTKSDFEYGDTSESMAKITDSVKKRWGLFWKESERGFAVLACSYFESFLQEAINEATNEMLGNLPKKTKAAFCRYRTNKTLEYNLCIAFAIGLLNEEMFHGLMVAKGIRNDFAHGKDRLSFEDKDVSNELEKLKFVGDYAKNWQQYGGFYHVAEDEIRQNVKHVREHYKNRRYNLSRGRT